MLLLSVQARPVQLTAPSSQLTPVIDTVTHQRLQHSHSSVFY